MDPGAAIVREGREACSLWSVMLPVTLVTPRADSTVQPSEV